MEKSYKRRSEHLRKVNSKDFPQKEKKLRGSIEENRGVVFQNYSMLKILRQEFILGLYHQIFTIEVLPLSRDDEGAEGKGNRLVLFPDFSHNVMNTFGLTLVRNSIPMFDACILRLIRNSIPVFNVAH